MKKANMDGPWRKPHAKFKVEKGRNEGKANMVGCSLASNAEVGKGRNEEEANMDCFNTTNPILQPRCKLEANVSSCLPQRST
jgi:hypothetical protein